MSPSRSKSTKLSFIGVISVSATACASRDRKLSAPGASTTMKWQVSESRRNAAENSAASSASARSRSREIEPRTSAICGMGSACPCCARHCTRFST
jgi:hypothetical protein